MAQSKETKEDLRNEIADLRRQLTAANRAGITLARCFKWDRDEYQSNPVLVEAVCTDSVARKWVAGVIQAERRRGSTGGFSLPNPSQ